MRIPLLPHEPPLTHVRADGVRVRISGYCCQCGDCCESGNPFTGGADPCPLFLRLDPERGVCTDLRHPYYVQGCAQWPVKAEQIARYPRCTYRVEVVP